MTKGPDYIKVRQIAPTGLIALCRGAVRAAIRRRQRALLKACR